MHNQFLHTIILIAACAISTSAKAQIVYKCGNTYSQLPCPEGVVINTADPRTPEQKAQADAATRRDAQAADAMEKARIEQEKRELATRLAQKPPAPAPVAASKTKDKPPYSHVKRKRHRHEPEHFTALAPLEKKKPPPKNEKKASKKS